MFKGALEAEFDPWRFLGGIICRMEEASACGMVLACDCDHEFWEFAKQLMDFTFFCYTRVFCDFEHFCLSCIRVCLFKTT